MGEKQAVTNILYSTRENPVDLNEDVDVVFAKDNEVCYFRPKATLTSSSETQPSQVSALSTGPWFG